MIYVSNWALVPLNDTPISRDTIISKNQMLTSASQRKSFTECNFSSNRWCLKEVNRTKNNIEIKSNLEEDIEQDNRCLYYFCTYTLCLHSPSLDLCRLISIATSCVHYEMKNVERGDWLTDMMDMKDRCKYSPSEVAYRSRWSRLLGNLSMVSHLTWWIVPPTLRITISSVRLSWAPVM